jgi:hypothetical protein
VRRRLEEASAALSKCTISLMPIKEKQKAVLGAIGIYVAQTLANNGNPEIQPMNVSNPSASSGLRRSTGLCGNFGFASFFSQAFSLPKHRHLSAPGRLLVNSKTHSSCLRWTNIFTDVCTVTEKTVRAKSG